VTLLAGGPGTAGPAAAEAGEDGPEGASPGAAATTRLLPADVSVAQTAGAGEEDGGAVEMAGEAGPNIDKALRDLNLYRQKDEQAPTGPVSGDRPPPAPGFFGRAVAALLRADEESPAAGEKRDLPETALLPGPCAVTAAVAPERPAAEPPPAAPHDALWLNAVAQETTLRLVGRGARTGALQTPPGEKTEVAGGPAWQEAAPGDGENDEGRLGPPLRWEEHTAWLAAFAVGGLPWLLEEVSGRPEGGDSPRNPGPRLGPQRRR
jgi:hypothetical protein